MNESLQKASHSAAFLCTELREAHIGSSPMASLLMLPMIERAELLRRDIANLIAAQEATS